MAITNYTELQASVTAWLINDDLGGRVTDIITLAEAEISRRLAAAQPMPPRPMSARQTATLNAEYLAQPANMILPRMFEITGLQSPWEIEYTSDENITQMASEGFGQSDFTYAPSPPRYYAIVGGDLRFYPIPTKAYALEMTFWQRLPALSAGAPTNWLLTAHPDCYLYGSLATAAGFIEDDDRIGVWGGLFDRALDSVIAAYPTPRDTAPLRSDLPAMRCNMAWGR